MAADPGRVGGLPFLVLRRSMPSVESAILKGESLAAGTRGVVEVGVGGTLRPGPSAWVLKNVNVFLGVGGAEGRLALSSRCLI